LVEDFKTQDLRANYPIIVEIEEGFLDDDEKKFVLN
jgi:hypothetical protein